MASKIGAIGFATARQIGKSRDNDYRRDRPTTTSLVSEATSRSLP